MKLSEIVHRVNQKMYEGLYGFPDFKYEMDDAIIMINNTLNAKFPLATEELKDESDSYNHFPDRYMQTVVIEYVVSELFRREGEFGNEYEVAVQRYQDNLGTMFRDLFDKLDEEYIDEETGVIPITPYEVSIDDE